MNLILAYAVFAEKRGRGAGSKPILFGILERHGKVSEIVPDASRKQLQSCDSGSGSPGSIIHSDGWRGYNGLVDMGYKKHFRVHHGEHEFARDNCHINGIESFWSTDNRTLEKVNTALRQQLRKKSRNPDPTAAIIESQSIKGTSESCLESGFDGGKLIKGRKNILVDTIGCLIIVRVFAANVFDGKAARQLITDLFSFLHTITKIWADSGYSGPELSDWFWHPIRMPDRGR